MVARKTRASFQKGIKNPYHIEIQHVEREIEKAYQNLRDHLGQVDKANKDLMILLGEFDYLTKQRLAFQKEVRKTKAKAAKKCKKCKRKA